MLLAQWASKCISMPTLPLYTIANACTVCHEPSTIPSKRILHNRQCEDLVTAIDPRAGQ